jgi:hypothetical protein
VTSSGFQVVQCSYVNTFLFLPILAVRLLQRLSGATAVTHNGSPDVFKPGVVVNRLLYMILQIEAKLLSFMSFPFGVGLFAIVRRPLH